MIKFLLLLNPIYVTLFWALVLNTNKIKGNEPKIFLGRFMIVSFLLYLSHLFYFLPMPGVYHYSDSFYHLFNLLVYPMYYIYIRLLTVDQKFILKKHGIYLLLPFVLFILYGSGVLVMTKEEHIGYLYRTLLLDSSPSGILLYQKTIYSLCRIVFIIQSVLYMWLSLRLVIHNKDHVQNYYANLEDDTLDKVHTLNVTLMITTIASILLSIIGKEQFVTNEVSPLLLPSILFSVMLFFIGWLGNKQRSLLTDIVKDNECKEKQKGENSEIHSERLVAVRDSVKQLFDDKKIYLNKDLTIWDVARVINTNRTYVSCVINNDFNQNFSSFVNSYRTKYAKELLDKNPDICKQDLADMSGFGSVTSMQRSFVAYEARGASE